MKKVIISIAAILLLLGFSGLVSLPTKAETIVTLEIDAATKVHSFHPEMLGSNIGIWENRNYFPKANPKLVNIIEGAGLNLLRFPAGGEADISYFDRTNSYVWYQGPAPYTRTIRADHLDAFISLCKQTGAEPLIVVNAKINNPEMAADIVRYCNVEHDYNVKYFEIGNETQYWRTITGEEYAERMAVYAETMKAVDPDILIMNAAPAGPTSVELWLTPTLKTQGDILDAITLHYYPLYDGVKDPAHPMYPSIDNLLYWDYGEEASVWDQMGSIKYIDRFVKSNSDSLVNLRNQYAPNALIGLTEVSPVAGGNAESGVSDTLTNALWFGDVLGRLAYNGVDFTNQFLLQSSPQKYAMIDSYYNIRPTFYAFSMYSRYFGDVMVETTSSDEGNLTIWASKKTGEEDKLYVMVVNKNQNTDLNASINFKNFKPASKAFKWELNSASISSLDATINGVSVDENCYLPAIDGVLVDNVSNNFTYTYPAHSVTSFEFTVKGQGNEVSKAATNAAHSDKEPGSVSEAVKEVLFPTNPTEPDTPIENENILFNGDFSNGITSWNGIGAEIKEESAIVRSSPYAMKAFNRTRTYHGPAQNITAALIENGQGSYNLNGWVKLDTGTDNIKVNIKVISESGTQYFSIGPVNGFDNTDWKEFKGTVNINWLGTLSSAIFYIETTTTLADLYVDDCSINKVIN